MNIENKKQMATILLAVGLGLVAAMLMSKVVSDKVDEQTKIIAREYQGRNAALVKEMEATKKTLKKLAQDHASLAQRVATQPTVIQQVAPAAQRQAMSTAPFSLRTPPGKRALTIMIDSLSAVGGLLNPGDFVDVIAHLEVPEEEGAAKDKDKKQEIITVLFQNLQVLAVGTHFEPENGPAPYDKQQETKQLNVTLAVSLEEAGLLAFAEANGDLQLSLRSPAETQDRVLQQVASWDTLADFVLQQQGTDLRVPNKRPKISTEEEEEEEPAKAKPLIQIFRGGREL